MKAIITSLFLLCPIVAFAQLNSPAKSENTSQEPENKVHTLSEVLAIQQNISERENMEKHFTDLWKRNGFFNIAYNTANIDITENNVNGSQSFSSTAGISLQSGANYKLHKKPIANTLLINLDFVPLDISANYYKGDGEYNSDELMYESEGLTLFRRPWNINKLDINYSMAIGPSITIAPFNYIKAFKGVHFFKLNAYFHVGYAASILMLLNNSAIDEGGNPASKQKMSGMSLDFGHGMYTSYGINLSWKAIGVGFERRNGKLDCSSLNTDIYGSEHYDLSMTLSRIYLNFRF